jgi:hypothetical protein
MTTATESADGVVSVGVAVSVSVGVSVSTPDVPESVDVVVVASDCVSVGVSVFDGAVVVVPADVELVCSGVGSSSEPLDCSAQPATVGRCAILVTLSSFRRCSSIG